MALSLMVHIMIIFMALFGLVLRMLILKHTLFTQMRGKVSYASFIALISFLLVPSELQDRLSLYLCIHTDKILPHHQVRFSVLIFIVILP